MSRIARIVIEGIPYHITQRGNARQQVFFEDRDYSLYRDLLQTNCQDVGLEIWAYCLMPNHIHLIAVPERAPAMAQAMGRTNADYARYYNLRNRACGHVWQARYFSTPMDTSHLWQAMAYVERNPVRTHLVAQAEKYPWSSARARLPQVPIENSSLVKLSPWQAEYDWPRWKEALQTSIDEESFGQRLQEASRRGRPLGDEQFIGDLENRCHRRLRPRPVGRPGKLKQENGNQMVLGFGV